LASSYSLLEGLPSRLRPFGLKFLTFYKQLLTTVLQITGCCRKNAIVSDFPGDIFIPKFFVSF